MKVKLLNIVVPIVTVCVVIIIAVLFIGTPSGEGVVVFNMTSSAKAFGTALSKNHALTQKEKRALVTSFARTVKASLNEYAQTHHVLIIKKTNTLTGGKDITAVIDADVNRVLVRQFQKKKERADK